VESQQLIGGVGQGSAGSRVPVTLAEFRAHQENSLKQLQNSTTIWPRHWRGQKEIYSAAPDLVEQV